MSIPSFQFVFSISSCDACVCHDYNAAVRLLFASDFAVVLRPQPATATATRMSASTTQRWRHRSSPWTSTETTRVGWALSCRGQGQEAICAGISGACRAECVCIVLWSFFRSAALGVFVGHIFVIVQYKYSSIHRLNGFAQTALYALQWKITLLS